MKEALFLVVQLLHVETDGGLSLSFRRIVGYGNIANKSLLGSDAGDEQSCLLGIVDGVRQQTNHLLWGMEGSTMRSYGIVPTPLALAKQCLNRLHLRLSSSIVDIPVHDYSTKAKAQQAIGLDMQKLNDKKQRFLQEIVPKWIDEAKKNGKLIEI